MGTPITQPLCINKSWCLYRGLRIGCIHICEIVQSDLRDGLSICEMWLYSYMRNGCVYIRIHSMRDVAVYRFIYARWCVYIYIHVCEIPHFTISIHSHCLNCHSMARMSFISALRSSCSNWFRVCDPAPCSNDWKRVPLP